MLALDRRPYRRRSIRVSRIAIYELRVTHARPTFYIAGPRYRLQAKLTSHSTIFNSVTKPTPQVCKNTLRHTCFERCHAKVPLSSREQRKLVTWYKRFQGCIVKGLLTKKTTSPPRKRYRSKMTNGHPCG